MATLAAIAAHLDLSVRRFSELRANLGLAPGCSIDDARLAYIRWLREKAAGREESNGDGLTYERTRLFRAQADKTELEARELRGEMVRAEDVIDTWGRMYGAARSRLLSLPSKAAPRARAAVSDEEASRVIEHEILEALEELSHDGLPDRTRARRARGATGAQTAAEVDGERVGRRTPATKPRKRRRAGSVED